jgi:hypothetical protein
MLGGHSLCDTDRKETNMTNKTDATIDSLKDDLLFLGEELEDAYDQLYEATLLLATCNSPECGPKSIRHLERCNLALKWRREIAESLSLRDLKHGRLLESFGVDWQSWARTEEEHEEG